VDYKISISIPMFSCASSQGYQSCGHLQQWMTAWLSSSRVEYDIHTQWQLYPNVTPGFKIVWASLMMAQNHMIVQHERHLSKLWVPIFVQVWQSMYAIGYVWSADKALYRKLILADSWCQQLVATARHWFPCWVK